MRRVTYLAIGLLLALGSGTAAGELDQITIFKPFGTPTAALNLKIYYKEKFGRELTDDEVLAFQSIDQIHYDVKRDTTCSRLPVCQNNFGQVGDYVYIERSINIDASEVDRTVINAIASQQKDACSNLWIRNIRRALTQNKRLTYTANIYAEKKTCYWLFGDQETTLATGEGDATVFVDLVATVDLVDLTKTSIAFQPLSPSVHMSDTDLLGFIDLETFIGELIGGLLSVADDLVSILSFDIVDIGVNNLLDKLNSAQLGTAAIFESGAASLGGSYQKFSTTYSTSKKYWLSSERTKLVDGNRLTLVAAYDAVAHYSEFSAFVRPSLDYEKTFLESFANEDFEYVIRPGDSYYRIAKATLGTGEVHAYLRAYNSDRATLHPGDTVRVPAVWRADIYFKDMVMPTDTLWARFLLDHKPDEWNPKKIKKLLGSPNIHKIFPYQRYADVESDTM